MPPINFMNDTRISTALKFASTIAWAIMPTYLDIIEDIAAGHTTIEDAEAAKATKLAKQHNTVAVTIKDGEALINTRTVEIREGVAIIPVHSVIFRRASMFDGISDYAASVQTLAKDFNAALNNPNVKAILFDFDTPGGEVNGISELAHMIYAARNIKPVYAYVGDMCASAGLWLAVACQKIYAYKTATVGSIGVLAIADVSKPLNRKRFTSEQSPDKALPADTARGEILIQKEINKAAGMFIDDVAMMRGVTVETVSNDFGKGAMLFADEAVEVGLIDGISTFETVLAELQGTDKPQAVGAYAVKPVVISDGSIAVNAVTIN